jgi:hypothetical protein
MTQYLVAIYRPDDYDRSLEDEAMARDIDALNDEMEAAGVGVFVGGLGPLSSARSLRFQPEGKALIADGPYTETKENTLAVFGCWKPLTWKGRWRGRARRPSRAGRRSRCVRFGVPTDATERHGQKADRLSVFIGAHRWPTFLLVALPTPHSNPCRRWAFLRWPQTSHALGK